MKNSRHSLLRGLTVQVLAIAVLPLTLLLLFIAFSSVFRHQQDMRSLVGERDERAVQSAAAALDAELHHRASNISSLMEIAELMNNPATIRATADLTEDFDGGIAYLTPDKQLITTTGDPQFWNAALQADVTLADSRGITSGGSETKAIFSNAFLDPRSKRVMIIVSQYSAPLQMIVAGAFSPATLADKIISTSYTASERATVYLLDSSRQPLYTSQADTAEPLPADHPGVAEALRGETGTLYVQMGESEHVIAYSPITPTGWVLITEESWQEVVSPSLQMTQ